MKHETIEDILHSRFFLRRITYWIWIESTVLRMVFCHIHIDLSILLRAGPIVAQTRVCLSHVPFEGLVQRVISQSVSLSVWHVRVRALAAERPQQGHLQRGIVIAILGFGWGNGNVLCRMGRVMRRIRRRGEEEYY
jgi:hypothetical protein